MSELWFKFIYNGEDSFKKLYDNMRKDGLRKIDVLGRYWDGWVKVENEKFYVEEMYFIRVLLEVKDILEDIQKILEESVSIPVEIYLFRL